MKVAINKCYGGFGISNEAEIEYLKLKGLKAYFYEQVKYEYKDGRNLYKKVNSSKDTFMTITFTKDYGESFEEWPKKDSGYFYSSDIPRDDPDLIKVIEKLGKKANNQFSDLKIVEIPDGTEYIIDEYDGLEHIAEKHKTWE